MSPDDAAVFGIRLAILSVSFVAAAVYLLQRKLSAVYGVSSLMFLAFAASQLVYVAATLWPTLPSGVLHGIHMVSYTAAFLLLPTFFIHLKLLSRTPHPISRAELTVHLALPALVFVLAAVSLFIPGDTAAALKMGQAAPGAAPWMETLINVLLLLEFGGYSFVLVYIWLLFRWRRQNRTNMQLVFASGERYEPYWTWGLAAILAFYVAQVLYSFFILGRGLGHPVGPIENSTIALLFILLVAIRGLQQAPGLFEPQTSVPPTKEQPVQKYSKSALAAEHAERIARKLHVSMSEEKLYRDPNLSLTKLAQHIGSSPNYVSQTLNEHMDGSFFDFVNQWRIEEAKTLLSHGNETILSITYEVGFNSRSAFYTAFKKHAGVTPSEFRADGDALLSAPRAAETRQEPARP